MSSRTSGTVAPKKGWLPERGQAYDVLRYLDYAENNKRPLVVDVAGGPGEMYRALREAVAAYYAAVARSNYAIDAWQAQEAMVHAMELRIKLHD